MIKKFIDYIDIMAEKYSYDWDIKNWLVFVSISIFGIIYAFATLAALISVFAVSPWFLLTLPFLISGVILHFTIIVFLIVSSDVL